jgi:two-component system chemotaxis sensor kinase CheA
MQGGLIPLVRLHRLFGVKGAVEDPAGGIVVVVEEEGMRTGILVDELLGKQNIVIKGLGGGIGEVDGLAGASIMSDGQVSLILDIGGIVRLAHERGSQG